MSQNKLEFMVKEIMKRFPECSYNINKSQKSDYRYGEAALHANFKEWTILENPERLCYGIEEYR